MAIFLGLGIIMAGLALYMGRRLGGAAGWSDESQQDPPSLRPAAAMTAAQPQKDLSPHLCNIEHVRMDPACPR